MIKKETVGACGLYCGACNHYRFTLPGGEHLLRDSNPKGLAPDEFHCKGCHSDMSDMLPGCFRCKIRECSLGKNISNCSKCDDFPCKLLIDFQNDGMAHHRYILDNLRELRSKDIEKWLAEKEERWSCKCGYHYTWYEKTCHQCGEKLTSYERK